MIGLPGISIDGQKGELGDVGYQGAPGRFGLPGLAGLAGPQGDVGPKGKTREFQQNMSRKYSMYLTQIRKQDISSPLENRRCSNFI